MHKFSLKLQYGLLFLHIGLLNETLYEVTVHDGSKIKLTMLLSPMKELITMNPTIRDAHNYTKISESISYECYKSVPSLFL